MKAILVGYRDVNFTNKDTGEVISGQSIFIEFEESGVAGLATTKIFLPSDKRLTPAPSLPTTVNIEFNMRGKVQSIAVIK